MILEAGFFELLEEKVGQLLALEPPMTAEVVRRSAAIKAQVVSEDEREWGRRTILNYGHTIAHGIEAATGYGRFLHGEAVSIGMMGAALISRRLGLLSPEAIKRQRSLLQRFGLPIAGSGVDKAAMFEAMGMDKKVREKSVRWVLLRDIGQAVIRDDVPPQLVAEVVEELMADL